MPTGQFVMLPVAPEIFDRVELWRVGGQVFQCDLSFEKLDELGYPPPCIVGTSYADHKCRCALVTGNKIADDRYRLTISYTHICKAKARWFARNRRRQLMRPLG